MNAKSMDIFATKHEKYDLSVFCKGGRADVFHLKPAPPVSFQFSAINVHHFIRLSMFIFYHFVNSVCYMKWKQSFKINKIKDYVIRVDFLFF